MDAERVRMHVRVPAVLARRAEATAEVRGVSVSRLVQWALESYLPPAGDDAPLDWRRPSSGAPRDHER